MNFLICKICETEVEAEKLYTHSTKCKEFYTVKEEYNNCKANVVKLIEKTSQIKNNLTTTTALQKYSR